MSDLRRAGAGSAVAQVILFDLAGANYAMNIRAVEEIIELQDITAVPDAEPWVAGETLFRGRAVPVVDLRARLGLPTSDATDETRIVIVAAGDGMLGVIVDAVSEVVDVPGGRLEPLSDVVSSEANSYLGGLVKIEDHLICVVDPERVIERAA